MNGIYTEKAQLCGQDYWVVKDAKTGAVFAIGDTVLSAVQNYETQSKNAEIAKELGVVAKYDDD